MKNRKAVTDFYIDKVNSAKAVKEKNKAFQGVPDNLKPAVKRICTVCLRGNKE